MYNPRPNPSLFGLLVIMSTAFLLSRIQFGFTIGFHILFPTLNIGLAIFLAIMEGLWLKTQNPLYLRITKFWLKIFALTFGMGVVSGIVLSYELGTNFGPFIAAVGDVLGPLFSYEVMSAFFLEAGFLGIMLFGWKRVSPKVHYTATLLVALGTMISAFWIMSANSWMQTPAGYHWVGNKAIVDNWGEVIFNPSFIPRFVHMMMASYVTASFFIAGISAWYLLKSRHREFAKACFSFALGAAAILMPLQIIMGDIVGIYIHHHQPLKTAAMEGLWETTKGAPLVLFALPNSQKEQNRYELKIPKLASLINTHHWNGEMVGLKSAPPSERPVISSVFYSFRIMVGLGFLLFALTFWSLWLRWRKQLFHNRLFLKLCLWLTPAGFISTIAGWMVAESGRQPWIAYQLLRTSQGASTTVLSSHILLSLGLFILVYGIVFSFYLYYLFSVIRKGPQTQEAEIDKDLQPFHYLETEVRQ